MTEPPHVPQTHLHSRSSIPRAPSSLPGQCREHPANTTWTAGKSGQSLAGFTITGFVNGDTEAALFGAEAADVSSPTVDASDPRAGSYVINVTLGTLGTPANYTLTFRKGTLKVH
jgi:hypothetical protein